MAQKPELGRTGWNKSPDDLAYEELLAQYAAHTDEDAPSAPESAEAKEPQQKNQGGSVFSRLIRDIGSPKEGRYARGRASHAAAPAPAGQAPEEHAPAKVLPFPDPAREVPEASGAAAPDQAPGQAPAPRTDEARAPSPVLSQSSAALQLEVPAPQAVPEAEAAPDAEAVPEGEAAPAPEAEAVPAPELQVIPAQAAEKPKHKRQKKQKTQKSLPFGRKAREDTPARPAAAAAKADLPAPRGAEPALAAAPGTALAPAAKHGINVPALRDLGQSLVGQARPYVEWAYDESYFLGVQILRSTRSLRRWAGGLSQVLSQRIPAFWQQKRQRLTSLWERFSDSTLFPYRDISRKTGQLRRDLAAAKAARAEGNAPENQTPPRIVRRYLGSLGLPLNRIANFLAPIVGCTILAACVLYFSSLTYGLSVEYSGHQLGFITDENVFYAAQRSVRERLIDEEYLSPENNPPSFQLTVVQPGSLMDQEALASKILEVSNNEVESADGVYVEGVFLGAVQDGREFLMYLDGLLESYRTGRDHETVQFIKNISVKNGVYPTSSVRSLTEIRDTLNSDQPLETVHTVKEGESLADIAKRYNTSEEQILSLNPALSRRVEADADAEASADEKAATDTGGGDGAAIQTMVYAAAPLVQGEELLVNRVDPGLGIQVTWREVYDEEIPFGTDYVDNSDRVEGWQQTISSGIPGTQEVTSDVTYVDGEKVSERRVDVETVRDPVNQRVARGTKAIVMQLTPGVDTSGSFLWPVEGGYVSAGLYGYAYHTGMDIATQAGTPIRASRGGIVTTAVNWVQWPYGKQVVINHGDGYITRYAHMSSVAVQVGQYVEQGQYLGGVGRTGNATGNHCHFEIKYYGQVMNPASYIGNVYTGIWGW